MNKHKFENIPDWGSLKSRYQDFWEKDEPLIIAHVQNPNPNRPEPEQWMLEASEEKYLEPDKFYQLRKWRNTAWNWHGDLFEYLSSSYGPNIFAGFCGAKVEFGNDTVWHEPVIKSLDEAEKIHFDPDNRYWKAHLETLRYLKEHSAGKQLFAQSDLGGITDWIASFMGAEQLLIETITNPEGMREFSDRLANEASQAITVIMNEFGGEPNGYVNWMPFWSDKPMTTVQDDMAVNFSPEMYLDIFMPGLRKFASATERTILHWHDASAHHVDNLLECSDIDLIQYGHDPTTGDFKDGIETMKKIQAAGKKLFISCVEDKDTDFFIQNLSPVGLAMIVNVKDDAAAKIRLEKIRGVK